MQAGTAPTLFVLNAYELAARGAALGHSIDPFFTADSHWVRPPAKGVYAGIRM